MSHHCKDEAHDHEGHDHDGPERGLSHSLFQVIDLPKVICLNELEQDSGQKVFKPWHEKYSATPFLSSDVDEQLIIHIPFTTGSVKLKSIAVYGEIDALSNPKSMKAFINRDDIDFDNVDRLKADQEWELIAIRSQDMPDYETKLTKFFNVRSLTLYFPENYGDERTVISYIGLSGEFTKMNKDLVIGVYESAANLADHKKTSAEEHGARMIQ